MTTQTAVSPSQPIAENAIRDPHSLHVLFCQACDARDLDWMVSFYEPGAIVVERTGELTIGTAAIRDHIAKLFALQPIMRILDSKTVVTDDLAQSSSHWECDAVTPDGAAIHLAYHGSELTRRQPDGTWRIVIDNPWGALAGA